jgi:CBS domain-containing protein
MLNADISGAPVVDDDGKLLGVLTEKDLIWKVGVWCCVVM